MKIGIDLGGSHIAIGLVDENNEIIEKRTYYISQKKGTFEEYIIESIKSGITQMLNNTNKKIKEIESIGIATPGNPQNGCIKNVVNLGIKEFEITNKLTKIFQENDYKPRILLENDGKCAAIAEKQEGGLAQYKDCVFLCIGTGIGGAVFMNNKFLKPVRNSGFEFGHMIIKKDGETCKCGNKGCFEAYCSKIKFKQTMQEILNIKEYISAKELTKIINDNITNTEIRNTLDEYVDNLAIGISNIINIFEPEAISIGGSMAHYDELILEKLRKKVYNGKYLFNKSNPPKILAATNENNAGIIGATLLENR